MQFNLSETSLVSLNPTTETATDSGRLPTEEETARPADWLVPSRVVGTDLQALTPSAVAVVPGVALRADVPRTAAGSLALPGGTTEDGSVPPPAPTPVPGDPSAALAGDEPAGVQRFILGVDEEPPPRIGPEGGSTMSTEYESAPDLRPGALPIVFGSPAPPLPQGQQPVDSADAVGESIVAQADAGTVEHRPAKTAVVLMAMGAVLGWRGREKEEKR
jgi:hypothetical protein